VRSLGEGCELGSGVLTFQSLEVLGIHSIVSSCTRPFLPGNLGLFACALGLFFGVDDAAEGQVLIHREHHVSGQVNHTLLLAQGESHCLVLVHLLQDAF